MRKLAISLMLTLVAVGGVGMAIAVADGPSTGTNTACATATVPDHTLGVDASPVYTITGTSTSNCNTVTYTIPTSTSTTTETVTSTPTTTSTTSTTPTTTTTTSTTSTTPTTTTSTTSTNPTPPPGGPIAGSPVVGQTLTAPSGATFQWYDESVPIAGATTPTYTVQASDLDHTIAVTVDGVPSSSTTVVQNPCTITDSTASAAVTDVQNTANSGKTICLTAGTYAITSLTVHQAAMTTLEAQPGASPQPTISTEPAIRANNLRIEGFHLSSGLDDNGSGNVQIVGNYYHDAGANGSLWFASTSDTTNSTVSELHNRMVNVQTNGSTFNDGWGFYGCDVNGQHYIQNYNTFATMNQHPLQLAGCATIQAIGNEYLNIWDQYSSQHADCLEIWGGAGASTIQDNRCTTQTPVPPCPGVAGGRCGSDFLLSGDSGPFIVTNNLIVNSPKQCFDDTPNGTFNGSMRNGTIENNTVVGCNYGAIDMTGGSSSGNTVAYNIADNITGNGNCSQFTVEDFNNGLAPHCPGTHDTNVTPSFTSTEPSNPNATYATTNVNAAWGYHPARVGFDAHLPN